MKNNIKVFDKKNIEQFLISAETGNDCFLDKDNGEYEASGSLEKKYASSELDAIFEKMVKF